VKIAVALGRNGVLTNTERGAEPVLWHHTTMTPTVTFTWHHTIPWNCLAAFWNGLVAGKHWTAVELFLRLVSADKPHDIMDQIKSGALMDRDRLHTQLTWQGWNIVEGPGGDFREDDPGEGYDRWFNHGLSDNQRATVQAVDQLYLLIEPLASRPSRLDFPEIPKEIKPNISALDAKDLARGLSPLIGSLRGRSLMFWNSASWEKVQDGRVHPKLPSVWNVKPKWKKRR